jgi:hypothetical protein
MRANVRLGGRYRLLEHIGSGGMSTVWRGYDEVLRRRVAVKVLNPEYASDAGVRAGVYREAQAVALLAHPHIAGVYDYGESHQDETNSDESTVDPQQVIPFVVMEFVPGPSLAGVLADGGTLPWPRATAICAQVASALAAAHARGIVHRDVKPANVIVGAAGAKVVDFGISALVGETDREPDGQLLGTPAYVAPERLLEGQAGTASDVYALGLLLYRTLAGNLPWDADTVTQMLIAHKYVPPSPLPPLDSIPLEARELCERCLAKDPDDRPSSHEAADILARLAGISLPDLGAHLTRTDSDEPVTMNFGVFDVTEHVVTAEVVAAPPATMGRTKAADRRRRVAATSSIAVVLLLVAGFLVWGQQVGATPRLSATAATSTDRCAVRYAMERAWADGFDASVTVSNSGERALTDATLRFAFAGDQTIAPGQPWVQNGHEVTAALTDGRQPLPPGQPVNLRLSASYRTENLLPTVFYVGPTRCDTSVAASMSVPAQQPAPQPAASQTAAHDGGTQPAATPRRSKKRGSGQEEGQH